MFLELLRRKNKCVFCGDHMGMIRVITTMENFYNYDRYFHLVCLRDGLCKPEKYDNRQADLAIEIFDEMKQKGNMAKLLSEMRQEKLKQRCNSFE